MDKGEKAIVERTTEHLIETLGNDIERCHAALVDSIDDGEIDADGSVSADYEYHARHLIRTVIAYIEAVTFSVKVYSVQKCMDSGIDVTDHERYLTVEVEGKLNEKGEIYERPTKIRLAQNVRFAFRLLEKANGQPTKFDPSEKWWSCFKETIRVRDRLAHPRMPADIDVSGAEIISALEAKNGFSRILMPDDNEA